MKFYNTPSLRTVAPTPKPELSGKELRYKLEDDYREYREACANRLCKSDPAVHADYKAKIAATY
jgi:hypothetical protein